MMSSKVKQYIEQVKQGKLLLVVFERNEIEQIKKIFNLESDSFGAFFYKKHEDGLDFYTSADDSMTKEWLHADDFLKEIHNK